MAVLGFLLFVVAVISVIYPLRFLMIPNRMVAVCLVILSFVMMGEGASDLPKGKVTNAASSISKPAFQSSGACKTDINGDLTCSHDASLDFGFGKSTSNSTLKCRTNLVTQAQECRTEISGN